MHKLFYSDFSQITNCSCSLAYNKPTQAFVMPEASEFRFLVAGAISVVFLGGLLDTWLAKDGVRCHPNSRSVVWVYRH